MEVYYTFVFAEGEDRNMFDTVVQKYDEHCLPKKNSIFERYVFRSGIQQLAESFHAFVMDFKLKARTCNFGLLQDAMICDQVVFGIRDKRVRERLLRETELTLADALKICHASE